MHGRQCSARAACSCSARRRPEPTAPSARKKVLVASRRVGSPHDAVTATTPSRQPARMNPGANGCTRRAGGTDQEGEGQRLQAASTLADTAATAVGRQLKGIAAAGQPITALACTLNTDGPAATGETTPIQAVAVVLIGKAVDLQDRAGTARRLTTGEDRIGTRATTTARRARIVIPEPTAPTEGVSPVSTSLGPIRRGSVPAVCLELLEQARVERTTVACSQVGFDMRDFAHAGDDGRHRRLG